MMGGSDREGNMSSSSCQGDTDQMLDMKRNHVLQCYKTPAVVCYSRRKTRNRETSVKLEACPKYHEFLRADPVVLRELDIKLDVKISLVEGVSVLWHTLSTHHPD